MTDVLVLAAVLALAGLAAVAWKRREGRAVIVHEALGAGVRERVGAPPDRPVLLLFTTPTCANCAAAREVLAEVAAAEPRVAVTEVDVGSHPDPARQHQVLRAPTVLVVDEDDGIRARISGVPDRAGLREALPT